MQIYDKLQQKKWEQIEVWCNSIRILNKKYISY